MERRNYATFATPIRLVTRLRCPSNNFLKRGAPILTLESHEHRRANGAPHYQPRARPEEGETLRSVALKVRFIAPLRGKSPCQDEIVLLAPTFNLLNVSPTPGICFPPPGTKSRATGAPS